MGQPTPPLIQEAFGRNAAPPYIQSPIPLTTVDAGRASFDLGFPPQTMTEIFAGGTPPYGQDVNGLFNMITANIAALSAGQAYPFNATLAAAMGGYNLGAVLSMTDGTGLWINTVAANATDPEGPSPAGWMPLYTRGFAQVTGLTGGTVTLTPAQYRRNIIVLSGTLSANLRIVLPSGLIGQRSWLIVNTTSGPFTTQVSTAAQVTGVNVPQGGFTAPVEVYGDGSNYYPTVAPVNLPIDQNPTANTIAQRTNGGYLFATYFNQTSPIENFGMAAVYADAGDGYHRKISLANFAAQIALSQFAGQVANAQVPASAVTQYSALILAQSVGYNQNWAAVGRAINTTYSNPSARPIQVMASISITSGGGNANVVVNGVQIASCTNGSSADSPVPFSFTVPPGQTYRVNGSGSRTGVQAWAELS